ncbi:tetratricopeptide repeat protein, partial [Novosphingobium sp. 18052]
MRKIVPLMAAICLASLPASAAYAAEPTIDQVHAAAASGQVGQALSMMSEVLKDHPGSAKAHYVEAELYAREGHLSAAESELTKAQQLAPGLPFARSQAVSQLSQELNGGGSAQSAQSALAPVAAPHGSWLPIAMLGAAAFGALYLLRRRSALAPGPFGGRPAPFVANPGIGAGYGAPASPWGGYASGGAG